MPLRQIQLQNPLRLSAYMTAPESNSPYAQNDNLETRGPTWEFSATLRTGKEGLSATPGLTFPRKYGRLS